MAAPAHVAGLAGTLSGGVAAVTATTAGRPRRYSEADVGAFEARMGGAAAVDHVAATVFTGVAAPGDAPAGFTATFVSPPSPSVSGVSAFLSPDGTPIAVTADRLPDFQVVAKKVERAALGPIKFASNSHGIRIVRGSTADQATTMRGLLQDVVNTLKDMGVIEEEVKDVEFFYDRNVVRYVDVDGKVVEKSILAEMEGSDELREQVTDLAICGHEIHGTSGYSGPYLSSKVKGSLQGSAALRRSDSDSIYRNKKTELAQTKAEISRCEAEIAKFPKVMSPAQIARRLSLWTELSNLKKQRTELEKTIGTYVLHERVPRTIRESKSIAAQDLSVPPADFEARTQLATNHLEGLRTTLKARYETKLKAYETAQKATPPTSKDELDRMEKELSALKTLRFRINEIDEYALTMAFAHCPAMGASDVELHAAVEKVRASVDAHYQAEHNKEYQERQKTRTWGQYFRLSPHNEPVLDKYKSDYAVDVGGLLFNSSPDANRLYHAYCLDHSIPLRAPHFTDELLTQMLKLEKDPSHNVEAALDGYFKGLAADDRAAVSAALTAAKVRSAPAPAPVPGPVAGGGP